MTQHASRLRPGIRWGIGWLSAVALALALAACSSSTPTRVGATDHSPTATAVPTPSPTFPSAQRPAEGGTPRPGTTTDDGSVSFGTAPPPAGNKRKDWAPLSVTLNTTCLDRGEELIVTATSDPFAGIGLAVGYSKPAEGTQKMIPEYAYFDHESNPTGTITWSFVVRPTIPYGPAILKVVVNGKDGRGSFDSIDFEVSNACA